MSAFRTHSIRRVALILAACCVAAVAPALAALHQSGPTPINPGGVAAPADGAPQLMTLTMDEVRDLAGTHMKVLGAGDDMDARLDAIMEAAKLGQMPDDIIADAVSTFTDPLVAEKAEYVLRGYAHTVMFQGNLLASDDFAQEMPGFYTPPQERSLSTGVSLNPSIPGGNPTPRFGGAPVNCPAFDYGPTAAPLTDAGNFAPNPTPVFQFHSSSIAIGDWTTYQWDVVPGLRYQFTFCTPGSGAGWDTEIRAYDVINACALLATSVDTCSIQDELFVTAPPGCVKMNVQIKGFANSHGNYTLGYRQAPCEVCASPVGTILTPTAACQTICGHTDLAAVGCHDVWYTFNLSVGVPYDFSTCPTSPTLPSNCFGSSNFDTRIEAYRPGVCSPRTFFNDTSAGCGSAAYLSFTPAAGQGGLWRIRVDSALATRAGNFCLAYRAQIACTAASISGSGPTSGNTDPASCSANQTFTVTGAQGTGPTVGSYVIMSPPLASAAPASGLFVMGATSGSFTSMLTKPGCADATFVVQVTLTNACSAPTQTFNYVLHDVSAPVMSGVPGNAIAECSNIPAAATPTAMDGCDRAPAVTLTSATMPGGCADSYTLTRTWTASDACGNASTAQQVISVQDMTPPSLMGVPASTLAECDAVPPPAAVTTTDNCDPAPALVFSETRTNGACPSNYTLTRKWRSTDRCGNFTQQTQTVTVVDSTPPVITPGAGASLCLWPPNHDMGCFTAADFNPVVTDNCSSPVSWLLAGCISSQPDDGLGDGNTSPDCIVAPMGLGVCVRSERSGNDPAGRTYRILGVAVDACGNVSLPQVIGTVNVPHDQGAHPDCRRPLRGTKSLRR